jgi:hypothetical protein
MIQDETRSDKAEQNRTEQRRIEQSKTEYNIRQEQDKNERIKTTLLLPIYIIAHYTVYVEDTGTQYRTIQRQNMEY